MSFSKDGNNLIIKQENISPLKINSIAQDELLIVNDYGKVAINSDSVTENAELYIVGDTLFNDVIYYRTSGDDKRIQAFSVSDNITEIRSVKELVIDEASGIRLDIDSEDTVTIRAPGVYERIYDTAGNDDYVQPIGKDTLKFIEHETGLLVTLLDTNDDTVMDSVELYNTLIDGGVINGDVTVNGSVYVEKVFADGSEIYNIPFYWQLNGLDLYYSSGNVGISTASPNYELDVRDLAFTDQLYVSENVYITQVDFENSTLTKTNDSDITFWIDTDDTDRNESFNFIDTTYGQLITIMEDDQSANYAKVGLFGKPDTNFHILSTGQASSLLLDGQSESKLVLEGDSLSATIGLNPSSGIPDYGIVDQFIFQSPARMRVNVNGSSGLYLSEYSVSIGDNTISNTFYVNGNARVGAGYAEDATFENAFLGLIVEGAGTIGNELAAPGYQFFSKTNMSIGKNADSIISDRDNFKGVVVEDRVGVGIDDSDDLFSVQGDMKIRDKMTFYEDGLSQFSISSSGLFSVSSNITEDLIFQLSDYISFFN